MEELSLKNICNKQRICQNMVWVGFFKLFRSTQDLAKHLKHNLVIWLWDKKNPINHLHQQTALPQWLLICFEQCLEVLRLVFLRLKIYIDISQFVLELSSLEGYPDCLASSAITSVALIFSLVPQIFLSHHSLAP